MGCLSVLVTWQLDSLKVGDPREPKTEASVLYNLIPVLKLNSLEGSSQDGEVERP